MSAVYLRDILKRLDADFPFAWAEPWDRVGLLVGDPDAAVERVFVTLDPTPRALEAAIAAGAQVLLTHHPTYLEAPERFVPADGMAGVAFAAASAGVALVAAHTNLDRAPAGAAALPGVLGLRCLGPLESVVATGVGSSDVLIDSGVARMGRVCEAGPGSTVGSLALRVSLALGVRVTVWGDAVMPVSVVGVAPGSGRSLVAGARAAGCGVLVTGELRYHEALDAAACGLAVIEAGHDATEWPLVAVLAASARAAGLDADGVVIDRPLTNWWTAEGA